MHLHAVHGALRLSEVYGSSLLAEEIELVARHVPEPTDEEAYRTLLRLMDRAAAAGLTSVQNASFDEGALPLWERAAAEGRL